MYLGGFSCLECEGVFEISCLFFFFWNFFSKIITNDFKYKVSFFQKVLPFHRGFLHSFTFVLFCFFLIFGVFHTFFRQF